jgi:putative ABC transport system substrate-binding protein
MQDSAWFAAIHAQLEAGGYAYWRLYGEEVGKTLNGISPADIPIQQPTKLILAVSLKTAKALGIEVPETLILRADKVID